MSGHDPIKVTQVLRVTIKPIVVATATGILISTFVSCVQENIVREELAKSRVIAPAAIPELSEQIKELTEQLNYSSKAADDFIRMVINWKDAKGEPIVLSLRSRLARARQEYRHGKISKGQLTKIEHSIASDLSLMIKKEFDYNEALFDLSEVIRHKQAQCLGYSQLLYLVGNFVGFPVNTIDVVEIITGGLPTGWNHVASMFPLTDGEAMIVDLALGPILSKPFRFEREFEKVGNYWELKDKQNPLGIHRRVQILDQSGLIACIHCNRAVVSYRLRKYTMAISECTKAIELNPRWSCAYYNRALPYATLGQFTKALSDFNKTIELDPRHANAFCERGVVYWKLGQSGKAFSDFNKAILLKPTYSQAYSHRGVVYSNLGQYDEAISDFKLAVKLNPKYADAHVNLGLGYAFVGKSEEAKEELLKAVKLNPAKKSRVKQISDLFKLNIKFD